MRHFYAQARRGGYNRRTSMRLAVADATVYLLTRLAARCGTWMT